MLFVVGAVASGINSVAGGGSLISFPTLTLGFGFGPVALGMHLNEKVANATNSVGLWPGSLAGGFGFKNVFEKTSGYLKTLLLPTLVGSVCGAWLLLSTSEVAFRRAIPVLILLASLLLLLQPRVKAWVAGRHGRTLPLWAGIVLQFFVSVYGGYFGAGMGIMMLATFALYMEGNTHELNSVKAWLGTLINVACSIVFLMKGLVVILPAVILALGSLVGGFYAAVLSQKFDPDRLRLAIGIYGFAMAGYFAWRAF